MGILAAYPTQRELPLSNQTRFSMRKGTGRRHSMGIEAWAVLTLGFLMGYVAHRATHDEE